LVGSKIVEFGGKFTCWCWFAAAGTIVFLGEIYSGVSSTMMILVTGLATVLAMVCFGPSLLLISVVNKLGTCDRFTNATRGAAVVQIVQPQTKGLKLGREVLSNDSDF
jgi:hypothetical protein